MSIDPISEVLRFKKIRGKENHYRIRVADYQIIYSLHTTTLIVRVIRIGHRRDVYRHCGKHIRYYIPVEGIGDTANSLFI
ncbi:MAG: type II toxin-antitoxin system RelE/ParE family toxin [Acidobacteria bacterium]|nr:type II toxin-antitoxin system RelE/ParE family toxin [Acidobacteriota bacterium]